MTRATLFALGALGWATPAIAGHDAPSTSAPPTISGKGKRSSHAATNPSPAATKPETKPETKPTTKPGEGVDGPIETGID